MKPSFLAGLLSLTLAATASAADPPAPAPPPRRREGRAAHRREGGRGRGERGRPDPGRPGEGRRALGRDPGGRDGHRSVRLHGAARPDRLPHASRRRCERRGSAHGAQVLVREAGLRVGPQRPSDARGGLHDGPRRRAATGPSWTSPCATRSRKDDFPGPRMYVAGPYVTITGGGGAMSGGLAPDIALPWDLEVRRCGRRGPGAPARSGHRTARRGPHQGPGDGRVSGARLRPARRRVHLRGAPRRRRGSRAQGTQGRGARALDRGHQVRGPGRRRLDRTRHLRRRRRASPDEGAGDLSRRRHLRRRVDPPGAPATRRTSPTSSPRATRSSVRTSRRPRRWA